MFISVIICTYNRCESLKDTLDSLLAQENDGSFDYEVLVVDNNSKDKTKEIVESYMNFPFEKGGEPWKNPPFEKGGPGGFPKGKLRYIFESKQGLSYARNTGIKESKGEIIAFTDDDCMLDKKWLSVIYNFFTENDMAILTGKVIPIWSSYKPKWYSNMVKEPIVDVDNGKNLKKVNYAVGCNMAYRSEIFVSELFSPDYRFEDAMFSKNIRERVYITYNPNLIVYHNFPNARVNQTYFIKWYFKAGEDIARLDNRKGYKLPKWRIKELVSYLICFGMNILFIKKSFFYKTRIAFLAGYFYQKLLKGKK